MYIDVGDGVGRYSGTPFLISMNTSKENKNQGMNSEYGLRRKREEWGGQEAECELVIWKTERCMEHQERGDLRQQALYLTFTILDLEREYLD